MSVVTFEPTAVQAKDPGETRFYWMDWTNELVDGATVSTSTWVIQSGLTGTNPQIVTGSLKTRITLSGGIAGADYICTNTVVTSAGETLVKAGIARVR